MKNCLKTNACIVLAAVALFLAPTFIAPVLAMEAVLKLAQKEKPLLLDTLKAFTAIESGSSDLEGLGRIGGVLAKRFAQLRAKTKEPRLYLATRMIIDIAQGKAPLP